MPRRSKERTRLPNRLIVLPNPDKLFHESWNPKRNKINIPHPFRMVAMGPPNSGKTLVVKNLILRAKPQFEEVYLIHCDVEYTKEYDDCGVQKLNEIPPPEFWPGEVKTLVILDDIDFKALDKTQLGNLDRLLGFCSTHKNISVCMCAQDPFTIHPKLRRMANFWILWRCPDIDAMAKCARRTGVKKEDMEAIFAKLMPKKTDSLWIDMTSNTPWPLRKNGFTPIRKGA